LITPHLRCQQQLRLIRTSTHCPPRHELTWNTLVSFEEEVDEEEEEQEEVEEEEEE
jgi:hypothetical protein